MEQFDAVVLAAGRLAPADAARVGCDVKALVSIGAATPLQTLLLALRGCGSIHDVFVVCPSGTKDLIGDARFIEEKESGQSNLLAGLATAATRRVLVCASDAPFVNAAHIREFLALIPADTDFAYPVFFREEFLAEFPSGRTRFARVGKSFWTGGSLCLLNRSLALEHATLISRAFVARRSLPAMASLLGVEVLLRYATGTLHVAHIERRLSRLTKGVARAIRGAHPALAMDCDSVSDIEYSRAHAART